MSAQFVARPRPYPDVHAPGASAPKSNQISERGTRSPPLPLVSVENQVFLTLVAVQAELRKLGRGWQPADERERRVALENAQFIRGLIEAGSNQLGEAHVKRLQVAAGGETPLMICAGKVRLLGAEEEGLRPRSLTGWYDGCGAVGADSTRVVPPGYRSYCGACDRKHPDRKHRQRERALYLAEFDDRMWGFSSKTGEPEYVTVCGCGALVVSSDVRQTSCADCRRRGRVVRRRG